MTVLDLLNTVSASTRIELILVVESGIAQGEVLGSFKFCMGEVDLTDFEKLNVLDKKIKKTRIRSCDVFNASCKCCLVVVVPIFV